jgi:hypothetical protein
MSTLIGFFILLVLVILYQRHITAIACALLGLLFINFLGGIIIGFIVFWLMKDSSDPEDENFKP